MQSGLSRNMGTIDKIYLDSNFIISILVDKHPQYLKSKKIIARHIEAKFFLSLLTLAETLHTLNVGYNIPRLELSFKLEDFLISREVKICDASPDYGNLAKLYLRIYTDNNLSPRDSLHYLIMKSNNIVYIATFDNDFIKNQEKLKIKVAV